MSHRKTTPLPPSQPLSLSLSPRGASQHTAFPAVLCVALGIPQTVSMTTGVRSEGRRERGEEGSATNTYHLTDKLLFVCFVLPITGCSI